MSNNNPKKKNNKKQNSDILDNFNINKINDPQKEREKIQFQIIKEVFDLYDTSKNGFIYGTDFKILLKTIDIQIKKKEVAVLLKENFNKDLNDKYKFEEFYKIAKIKFDELNPDDDIRKNFLLLCDYKENDERDEDGLILNKQILTNLVKNLGETMNEEEIDEIIEILTGGENNGEISINMFIRFMKNPIEYEPQQD
jgi:Ca2+-binding EF-hand superfamily protein